MNILLWWDDFDGKMPIPTILKPRPIWTGKQVGLRAGFVPAGSRV